MTWARSKKGFTIVELLVVIVVIAILAAITIVSYTNVTKQAKAASLQSEIASAVSKIESTKTLSGTDTYPSTIASFGLSSSTTYYYSIKDNTYCVERADSSSADSLVYSATNSNSIPAPVPCARNGLLGWWKLNGNSAEDSGPYKLNGIVNGTTSTSNQLGVLDKAVNFSISNTSYINMPSSNQINDAKTFAFWIRPTSWSTSTASVMLVKRSGIASGFFIGYINVNDVLTVDCGGSAGGNRWPTNYKPTLNEWAQVTVTCSTEDGIKLYVNGALRDQRNTVDRTTFSTTADLHLGRDSQSATLYFNGGMDDVRIYNRVLTLNEVQNVFAENAQ